jgi:hypothetical protein
VSSWEFELKSHAPETCNIIVTPELPVAISGESIINFMAKNNVLLCATDNVVGNVTAADRGEMLSCICL